MRRFAGILLGSVIAAAFIGPGTVTTAALAGVDHGYALLWALAFSTVACLVLQEAAARVAVASGLDLGEALRARFPAGWKRWALRGLVLGAIVIGCAAYEAGNILGGGMGARLAFGLETWVWTAALAGVAAALLALGGTRTVARSLAAFVALMGVAFLVTAWRLDPPLVPLLEGTFVPTWPDGAGLLVLGLVGTTVVPYNLFLGAGLACGQRLEDLRLGLAVSVIAGGLISMAVVVVGAAAPTPFAFASLASLLVRELGAGAERLFALGLLAAGLSSAITAPLAAALTARGVLAKGGRGDAAWSASSWRFRAVWIGVLACGAGFGLTGVRPIPAIVLAQALNGVLLPWVAAFLMLAVNDPALMGRRRINGPLANLLLGLVVACTVALGAMHVTRAASSALGLPAPRLATVAAVATAVVVLAALPMGRALRALRRVSSSAAANSPQEP